MSYGQDSTRGLSTLAKIIGFSVALTATAVAPAGAAESADEAEPTYQWIVREDTAPGEAPAFEVVETTVGGALGLMADPEIAGVELDGYAHLMWRPSDPDYLDQWEHHVTGMETAWDTTRGSEDIVIAVVDSGVEPGPEFGDRLLDGQSFIGGDPQNDPLGHGTAVAGVAAAGADNGVGGVGVCSECTILPVQVAQSNGAVPWSSAANGVVWAVDQGADILNLSFGSQNNSPVLQDAIEYALSRDVIVIAAAGNYGTTTQVYPAALDDVIAVAGHDRDHERYSWSSNGQWADVAAPGCARSISDDGTGVVCGTSFASPWAAGAAALLLDVNETITQDGVELAFESTAIALDWVEAGAIDASILLEGGVADLTLERDKVSARTVDLAGQYRGDVVRVDLLVDGEVEDTDEDLDDGVFDVTWDASSMEPGFYDLAVDAVDAEGDVSRSGTVTLQIIEGAGFTDVQRNAFYEEAVAWMVADEITTGTSPSTFSPSDNVTRGQLATFLYRFAGEPSGAPVAPFSDTSPSAFYADGVNWMVDQGITNGTSPTTFSPNDPVTRGQLAAFLHRYAGSPAPASQASFADVSRGSFYAEAVDFLVAEAITTGTSPTTFSPDSPVTRGQLATFLWRFAGEPLI
ncbi:MAG: S8 family serine peptidase [Actinomycetota bacterium]